MKDLDIRDIHIIDSMPVYNCDKKVLNVGCGEGRIDYHLSKIGYDVLATDIASHPTWQDGPGLRYECMDIFKPIPENKRPIVICSETLEHIRDYKTTVKNLLDLTEVRLIITVPALRSFFSPDHVHFWGDIAVPGKNIKDINEFKILCSPYSVSIGKIRTKPEDAPRRKWGYVIIVDKRQRWSNDQKK